jgi:transcriptional regulator of acetoin/glycerol metabolism
MVRGAGAQPTESRGTYDDAPLDRLVEFTKEPMSIDDIVPLEDEERRIIRRALELTNWDAQEASRRLRIGRATIYRKIERYGLRTATATRMAR